MTRSVWLMVYSIFMEVLFGILWILSYFFPKLRPGVHGRQWGSGHFDQLKESLAPFDRRYLFFCSSAGEYEQAKPIMASLNEKRSVGIVIVFFSPSGPKFAKARGEEYFFHLAPPDSVFRWTKIFEVVQPQITFVVRYELWPGFLSVADKASSLWLVDAVSSPSVQSSSVKRFFLSRALRRFDRVFAVRERDHSYFKDLGLEPNRLSFVGDTKYDRVMQYKELALTKTERWKGLLAEHFGASKTLVVGSAWHKDIELIVSRFVLARAEGRLREWNVVLVPHDTSSQMLCWIEEKLSEAGLPFQRLSRLSKTALDGPSLSVLVVDKIGLLAEIYGTADAAFVGGALHFRVHNVLEPASFGLKVAFGPKFSTSMEACQLVEEGLATVISSQSELIDWWDSPEDDHLRDRTLNWLKGLCGASSHITEQVELFESI